MRVRCGIDRGTVYDKGTLGVHCPRFPPLSLSRPSHKNQPPMRSHARPCTTNSLRKKEKRGNECSRGSGGGEREARRTARGILRENPCHCLHRREEVFESVNSFRGNKHERTNERTNQPTNERSVCAGLTPTITRTSGSNGRPPAMIAMISDSV